MSKGEDDSRWQDAFEEALERDEQQAYLQVARQMIGDEGVTEQMLAADPLILLEPIIINDQDISTPKLDVLIRVRSIFKIY